MGPIAFLEQDNNCLWAVFLLPIFAPFWIFAWVFRKEVGKATITVKVACCVAFLKDSFHLFRPLYTSYTLGCLQVTCCFMIGYEFVLVMTWHVRCLFLSFDCST